MVLGDSYLSGPRITARLKRHPPLLKQRSTALHPGKDLAVSPEHHLYLL